MRRMMKRKRLISIALALSLALFMAQGCATVNHNEVITGGFKVLATSATTYETAFAALADLYQKGLISDDDKQQAVAYGSHFWAGYHISVELLASYAKTNSAEDEAKLNAAIIEMSRLLGVFLEYVGPFLTQK
jgi:hypothetical protein